MRIEYHPSNTKSDTPASAWNGIEPNEGLRQQSHISHELPRVCAPHFGQRDDGLKAGRVAFLRGLSHTADWIRFRRGIRDTSARGKCNPKTGNEIEQEATETTEAQQDGTKRGGFCPSPSG